MSSEIPVLVAGVGGGGHGLEVVKAFQNAKHKYKIIATDMWENSFGLFEVKNRYLIPPASSENYIESLLKICKKEEVKAVATGSEPELKKVAQNRKLFEEEDIAVLLNPWKTIELCTDKLNIIKFLESKGISCPKCFIFENEEDVKEIEQYPVIVKPRIGGGSQYVFVAQDNEELLFFTSYLRKYGYEPLVQEYLKNYDEEYTIGVLYADNGKLISSIAMKRKLGSGLSTRQIINVPNSSEKLVVSSGISQGIIDDFPEIRKQAENIASKIGADGPVNIQCRKKGDKIIPFEINPRFSGTSGPRSLVGHSEPDIFCRYKLFNEIPEKIEYKFGHVVRGLVEKYISNDQIKTITKYE